MTTMNAPTYAEMRDNHREIVTSFRNLQYPLKVRAAVSVACFLQRAAFFPLRFLAWAVGKFERTNRNIFWAFRGSERAQYEVLESLRQLQMSEMAVMAMYTDAIAPAPTGGFVQ